MSPTHLPYRPALRITGPSNGSAIVLGNSLGTDTELWLAQSASLSQRGRVICFDYPGHGNEQVAVIDDIASIARGLLASLDDAGITRFAYCGISMGAAVGLELAAMAPDRVSSLVLANTAARFGPSEFWQARIETSREQGMAALAAQTVSRWIREEHASTDPRIVAGLTGMFARTQVEGYVQCCNAVMRFDGSRLLSRIAAPTLIIAGTFDKATTAEQAQALHSSIRGSRYVELPAAHLSNVDEPEAFLSLVESHWGASS